MKTRIMAIPLFEEGCDYPNAAHARRGLLRNDLFHMEPVTEHDCPILHKAKWRPLRSTDLPDGTIVTIRYHFKYNGYNQITVQLGRCLSCGERIDIGKSLTCSQECQDLYKKKTAAKPRREEKEEESVQALIKKIPKELLATILAGVEKIEKEGDKT